MRLVTVADENKKQMGPKQNSTDLLEISLKDNPPKSINIIFHLFFNF